MAFYKNLKHVKFVYQVRLHPRVDFGIYTVSINIKLSYLAISFPSTVYSSPCSLHTMITPLHKTIKKFNAAAVQNVELYYS